MNTMFKNKAGLRKMGLIIAVVVVVAALAAFFVRKSIKKETFKIGAILSLSGAASHLVEVRDAMLLAADEINSWGGINGRKIELIIEDSKTDPQEGENAFTRIESMHHPMLYVSTSSSVSMALAPLAEEKKVVLVGLVVSATEFAKQKEWVFRYYASAENEVPPIIYLLQELKVRTLGILYLNDEYGTSVFELLKDRFEKMGGTVRSEAFGTEESDFKEQITKLRDMQAIYAVGFVRQIGTVFVQLKEDKYNGLILGPSGVASLAKTIPEVNDIYFAAPIIYNPNYLFAKAAKGKYEGRYEKPFTHQAANGYDFVKLLASLLEGKDISRENVKDLLEKGFIYPGVFGDIHVNPGEHDITFPLHPAQIVDGEVKYLR